MAICGMSVTLSQTRSQFGSRRSRRPIPLTNATMTSMIKTDTATFPNVLKHVVDKFPSARHRAVARKVAEGIVSSTSPEAIWMDIQTSAARMAVKEPCLSPLLKKLVLRQPSLIDALAAVLAHQMRSRELSESSLCKLMRAVFRAQSWMIEALARDCAAVKSRDPACPDYLHVLLNLKGFHALQVHRLAHELWQQDRRELAFHIANAASRVYSIDIHPAARIGTGVMLDHGTGIVIGETTVVEDNVSLLQNVTLGGTGKETGDRHPKVRSGVMIGAGAKILGNIEIGAMSKVAAGSVVLHPVPPNCTVAGVPARIVRQAPARSAPSFEMDQSV